MKRILYFIQVPWDWIRQRPHFIAEGLASRATVQVCYYRPYRNRRLVQNPSRASLSFRELYTYPAAYLSFFNRVLVTLQLRRDIASHDILWLTSPLQFAQLRGALGRATVVYDCMDDMVEFARLAGNDRESRLLARAEEELVERCDHLFVSSEYLGSRLAARCRAGGNYTVVNNGASIAELEREPSAGVGRWAKVFADGCCHLTYLGTIAEWFDFGLVLAALDRHETVVFDLFGPSGTDLPAHERLRYHGPVPHEDILSIMRLSHALVMPFRVTELVRSVNPVKLYEYVYSGRPAIAVEYGESRAFGEHVHLYRNDEEFMALVGGVASGRLQPKSTPGESLAFVRENSWERRTALIAAKLGLEASWP